MTDGQSEICEQIAIENRVPIGNLIADARVALENCRTLLSDIADEKVKSQYALFSNILSVDIGLDGNQAILFDSEDEAWEFAAAKVCEHTGYDALADGTFREEGGEMFSCARDAVDDFARTSVDIAEWLTVVPVRGHLTK